MRWLVLLILLTNCGRVDSRRRNCAVAGEDCHAGDETSTSGSESNGNTKYIPGPPGRDGSPGKQGDRGEKGNTGNRGTDGSSCRVDQAVNGALISCTDGTSVVILDGEDAPPTPYTVTELVDPCGKQGQFDEVLLRLGNGQLMAHYASGADQYLTILSPGNYRTTDGTNCYFTVTNDYAITNEHN